MAALLALLPAAYVVVMAVVAPPTESNWQSADPILALWPRAWTVWVAPALAVTAAFAWWRTARPNRRAVRVGLVEGLFGVGLAVVAVGVLRLACGASMPSFIPPEESAAPGLLLNMTAGLEEEVVCRLGLMPVGLFWLRSRVPPWVGAAGTLVVTGLFFSLWHAAGEPSPSAQFFATRMLIPGCAMGAVWLASPSAIVSSHCAAHLLIPALFVPAPS